MTEQPRTSMTPEQAVREVERRFPIADYFEEPILPFLNIATTVQKYLPAGARVLDFGAGAGDKAAVLQMLGYRCTAYDDLDDGWHNRYGNRERILAFARDRRRVSCRELPKFPPGEFDMVMLFHVLEHFQDSPRDLLNDLLEAAKPEGLLFVKMPNLGNIRKRISVLRGKSNLESYGRFYWTPGKVARARAGVCERRSAAARHVSQFGHSRTPRRSRYALPHPAEAAGGLPGCDGAAAELAGFVDDGGEEKAGVEGGEDGA